MHTEFKTIWQSNIFEVPCCGSKMKSLRNGTQVLLLFHLKWVFLMLMLGLWAAVHLFTLRKCTAFAPPRPHTHTHKFPLKHNSSMCSAKLLNVVSQHRVHLRHSNSQMVRLARAHLSLMKSCHGAINSQCTSLTMLYYLPNTGNLKSGWRQSGII